MRFAKLFTTVAKETYTQPYIYQYTPVKYRKNKENWQCAVHIIKVKEKTSFMELLMN